VAAPAAPEPARPRPAGRHLGPAPVVRGDGALTAERRDGPAPRRGPAAGPPAPHDPDAGGIAVPLRLRAPGGGELAFLSTITTFGTATDVTVAELAIESFFPADAATVAALRGGS